MVRLKLLAEVSVVAFALSCMPYVGRPGREKLVRVAIECGVDQVRVSGIRDNKYYSDYWTTQSDIFPFQLGPKDGKVAINGRDYRGSLEVRKIDGNLWVINVVDIESYLKGVVPCEIGGISERQIEAAKAQAVAARTYARAHMGQYQELGFDLYATVQDQVYNGIACERELTSRAVESTAGEVLLYMDLPIEAKYHSTCGGHTADFSDVWPGDSPPYLRSVRCEYCKNSPHYSWKKEMTKKEFFALLRNRLNKVNVNMGADELIHSFRLNRNKRSQRVTHFVLVTNKKEYTIPTYRLRTLFGQPNDPGGLLKSSYVFIKTKGDKVIIEGRGFGHGVGMCQFGAMEMANQGKNYRQILYHYYRGTRIRKMR
jgi:stage II sporulation protein D